MTQRTEPSPPTTAPKGEAAPGAIGRAPGSRGAMLFRVVFTLSVFAGMGGWYVSEIVWGYPRWPSIFTGCAVMVTAYLLLLAGVFAVKQLLASRSASS